MISDITIKRPVLASMMMVAVVLFGVIGLILLPVRELPDVDPPVVTVTTVYPGASASVVEVEITEKLEEQINSIEGIKSLRGESREQVSNITVEFNLSANVDVVAQEVRDRVARARGDLPRDAEEPIVIKQDSNAQPMLWIALYSNDYTTRELTDIAEDIFKDRLQTVEGVSSVIIGGEKRFAIRIQLDPAAMAAREVTVLDVQAALAGQNVELPSGRVENRTREFTVETRGQLNTQEEFNQLIIRNDGTNLIRLADIGRAIEGVEDERAIARYNGEPAVGLGIVRQSKANTIEVAEGIKAELERIIPIVPPGIEVRIAYDESLFIARSIREVWITLGIAFALVVLVIFMFLRDIRSTLVPSLSIPICILGTFAVLYFMGYTINIITMLALVLAIGVVVDDSIIVLENIFRNVEEGLAPMDAAFKGMGEIVFAIIASTLSLVAVFFPLAFQSGLTGRIFVEFAFGLCGAVILSSFVALTFTPMITARVLRPKGQVKHGAVFRFFENVFLGMNRIYERVLGVLLRHRFAVMVVTAGIIALSSLLFFQLKRDFLPDDDRGLLLSIAFAPEGSTSEFTDSQVRKMESIISDFPETEGYFTAVALPFGEGPGNPILGIMFTKFNDDRDRSLTEMLDGPYGLGARMWTEVEGAIAFSINPNPINFSFSQPFEFVLQNNDLQALQDTAEQIQNVMMQSGMLANVRVNFELNKPQLQLEIDRDRAGTLDVSIETISSTLQILFGGLDLSKVKRGPREYDVIVQLDREDRLTPDQLESLYVRSGSGEMIQLSSLVTLTEVGGPNAIYHYNRQRAATIEGTPMGVPLGTVIDFVERQIVPELPPGFRYEWAGQSRDLQDAGRDTLYVFVLAIIIVYIVLAAQFESMVHPFTVMFALPLAFLGAFGSLWLLDQVNTIGWGFYAWANWSPDAPGWVKMVQPYIPRIPAMNLNIYSQIGMVLLVGLVTKNSILLVEFANQQMAKGMNAVDAMLRAGSIRLRPILMTAIATIMGVLPLAIGFGAGAESRRPMGVAIVGGMMTSTFLTLLVIPVVYTLLSDLGRWTKRLLTSDREPATSGSSAVPPPIPKNG